MTTKTTSQTQQNKTAPDAAHLFNTMAEENLARMEGYLEEMAKMQEKGFQQAQTAIDEASKLMKEQVAYSSRLTTEFQRIALEGARQAAQLVSKPWTSN